MVRGELAGTMGSEEGDVSGEEEVEEEGVEMDLKRIGEELCDHVKKIGVLLTRNKSVLVADKTAIQEETVEIKKLARKIMGMVSLSGGLLKTVKQISLDIKELKETRQQVPVTTYASAAAAGSRKKPETLVTKPAMVISSKNPDDKSKEIMEQIRAKVSFRKLAFAPSKIQPVAYNKVRVEFEDQRQRDEAMQKFIQVQHFTVEVAKRRNPLIQLKGIHKSTGKEELIEVIKLQNPTLGDSKEGETMELKFLKTNRNPNLYNAVIQVSPVLRKEALKVGRICIDHQRVQVEDFTPFLQCFKCLGFGHTQSKCEGKQLCAHCTGEHSWRECQKWGDKKAEKCHNCSTFNKSRRTGKVDEAHSATNQNKCTRIKNIMRIIEEGTNYGQ